MEIPQEAVFPTILILLVYLLSFLFNGLSIWIVKHNEKISKVVGMYFFCDNIARIINSLITIFYTTPCAFTVFCTFTISEANRGSFGYESNRIAGYIRTTLNYTVHFLTLAMAINRFLAVFRDGQWYNYVTRKMYLQGVVLMGTPFLVTVPLLMKGQACYYSPSSYSWYHTGEIATFIITTVGNSLIISILIVVIGLDSSAAWMVRQRMNKQHNSSAVRKIDVQIMKQVFSNHAVTLLYHSFNRYFDQNLSFTEWTDFIAFVFYELIPAMIDVYNGLSRAYLLHSPKTTEIVRPQTVQKVNSGNLFTTTTIHNCNK